MVLYLEDDTPVRTIKVQDLADDICAAYLRGHFETAGPVGDVKIRHHQNKRIGYVTFVRPEDCFTALHTTTPKFTVTQAENAFQPKPDPNALKFEEINNDCMLAIASNLSLIDIINLSGTSTRLKAFAEQIFRKYRHFTYENKFTATINDKNLDVVLRAIGVYIESIVWYDPSPMHLDLLNQHCQNVRVLKLMYPDLAAEHWKRNKSFFGKLETLGVSSGSLYDASLKVMVASPDLKSVELRRQNLCRGKFLSNLKSSKLKYLALDFDMDSDALLNFVRRKELSIFASGSFRFDQCATLPPELLAEFEEIELNFALATDDNLNIFAAKDFKRLTNLAVRVYNVPATLQYKILIAIGQITTLQSLTVKGMEIDVATFNCLGLFKNLQKIRFVDVTNQLGRQFFSTLHTHLPKITELSMRLNSFQYQDSVENSWVCVLIASLGNLKFFEYSSMTWELINMIVQERQRSKRSAIVIRVDRDWLWRLQQTDDEEKKFFAATNSKDSKRLVRLMVNRGLYF